MHGGPICRAGKGISMRRPQSPGTGNTTLSSVTTRGETVGPSRRQALRALGTVPALGAALAAGTASAHAEPAQKGPAHPPSGRFVIEAGWTLVETASGDVSLKEGVSVLVADGMIEDVIQGSAGPGLPRVQAPGDILLPGFISGHTHACSATPTRGIIEGGRSYAAPLLKVETLSDDELDALTAYNVAELLLSGCTTHVEMALSLRQAESYARVAEAWGVRGYPGGMVPGILRLFPIWFRSNDQTLFDSEADTLAEIAANLAFGKAHMGKAGGLIRPMMTPHAADTQTPATMAAFASAAKTLGTGIHIHLAQGPAEVAAVKRLWDMSPAQFCDAHGLMDGPFFAAHMTAFDFAKDAALMRERGGVYATCPSAGGAGGDTQPWPEALASGMRTNIGIDTHSNDYLENLKLAVLLGQARASLLTTAERPLPQPSIWDAVDAATRVPADGLGRPDLGRIRPGARADMTTVDVSGFLVGSGAKPPEPLNNLLYAGGRSVRHVLTEGRFQVWHGKLVVADAAQVSTAGGAAAQRIWDMLDADGWFDGED